METNNLNEPKGRLVINCSLAQAANFFNRLKKIKEITLKSYKKATDTVLQERYFFTAEFESISIVHETRSNMLIITASDHILSLLKDEFELAQKTTQAAVVAPPLSAQKTAVKAQKAQSNQPKATSIAEKQALPPQLNAKQQPKQQNLPVVRQAQALQVAKQKSTNTNQPQKQVTKSPKAPDREEVIKGVSRLKLESMLSKISSRKNADYTVDKNSFREGCEIYILSLNKCKITIKYYADKFLAQLNGSTGKLFDEALTLLNAKAKVPAADNKLKVAQRKLNKMMPHAFDVLSEQSRADFCIGMIDINNDNVRVSDYSMLLVPPYRGLECLISQLQKAKGIDVKMIGQAYEKLEGKYVLKSGYRKRMNSHVYCEVLSALYIEYFEKRNFYAHSDITGDSLSRIISDKSTAKDIFNRLIDLIEYNIFKLKEINFWPNDGERREISPTSKAK